MNETIHFLFTNKRKITILLLFFYSFFFSYYSTPITITSSTETNSDTQEVVRYLQITDLHKIHNNVNISLSWASRSINNSGKIYFRLWLKNEADALLVGEWWISLIHKGNVSYSETSEVGIQGMGSEHGIYLHQMIFNNPYKKEYREHAIDGLNEYYFFTSQIIFNLSDSPNQEYHLLLAADYGAYPVFFGGNLPYYGKENAGTYYEITIRESFGKVMADAIRLYSNTQISFYYEGNMSILLDEGVVTMYLNGSIIRQLSTKELYTSGISFDNLHLEDGTPIVNESLYLVAMNLYLSEGRGGFIDFLEGSKVGEVGSILDALFSYYDVFMNEIHLLEENLYMKRLLLENFEQENAYLQVELGLMKSEFDDLVKEYEDTIDDLNNLKELEKTFMLIIIVLFCSIIGVILYYRKLTINSSRIMM